MILHHSDESELGVLGACIQNPSAMEEVRLLLKADDFYKPDHAVIYKAMCNLQDRNHDINVITTVEELKRIGELENRRSLVASLTEQLKSVQMALHFTQIVLRDSRARRIVTAAHGLICSFEEYGADIDQIMAKFDSDTLDTNSAIVAHDGEDVIREVIDDLENYKANGRTAACNTGFRGLPLIFPSDLCIIAGRPGMGKTAFMTNTIENMMSDGKRALVFSFEMSRKQIMQRISCQVGRITTEMYRDPDFKIDGVINHKMATVIKWIKDKKLVIVDQSGLSTAKIKALTASQIRKHQIDCVFIDYLELIVEKGQDRRNEIGNAIRNLKFLAKDYNVPVFILCQLNRKCEDRTDKRPLLSDLKESGDIEQNADQIMLLYRDEYYTKEECKPENKGIIEVIIGKDRHGPTGICKFTWDGPTVTIMNQGDGAW